MTESTTFRINKEVKKEAYAVLNQIGLKPSQAINLFLKQIAIRGAIPFELRGYFPNKETLEAIYEANNPDKLKKYNSFSEIRKELDV